MGKGDAEKYRAVEKAAAEWANATQKRKDIDQATKNKIVLAQSAELDKLRKERGIRE